MISPSVEVSEFDGSQNPKYLSNIGVFFAGFFEKGPSFEPTIVYNILDFKTKFGKPNKRNFDEWFQIYNYFQYNNDSILISRVIGDDSFNSFCSMPNNGKKVKILNDEDFLNNEDNLLEENNIIKIIAKTPGEWGNSIKVAIFTSKELDNNIELFNGIYARNIITAMLDGQYCICIFNKNKLVERFLVDFDKTESINEKSNYIYLKERFLNYKYYDGNLYWIEGNEIIADGNLESSLKPIFFGPNILNLDNGYSEEPTKGQISDEYLNITETEDFNIDFAISNPRNHNAAIKLSKIKNIISFIGIPKDYNPSEFIKNIEINKNLIIYDGYKKQFNPFTGKDIWVSVIGDIVGLRSSLMQEDIKESHCKRIYDLKINKLNNYYNNIEIDKLYLNNINIIRKDDNGHYSNSENMLDGKKLSNLLILYKLEKNCINQANYFIFEQNDEFSRYELKKSLEYVCREAKQNDEIEDFNIICDESNNNIADTIKADIYYKPKYLVEKVKININVKINI